MTHLHPSVRAKSSLTYLCLVCGVVATHNLSYTEPNLVEVLCIVVVIVVGVIRLQKNSRTKVQ